MSEYKVNKGFDIEQIKNGVTLFDPEGLYVFTLNETGAFIFKKIKNHTPMIKIIKALEKKYSISNMEAEKDVKSLLVKLVKNKIIRSV
ncbi:hypothetical protein A3F59_03825 [Candidatus Roizmanbacteria bacterium RIFCSPHIGHO2_12_FULL_38_13]|nr:MAG: hypothetical protein A3F59_03825 [Candidatus Roizmanbacteria bacterium RIFCSPHIGHO2_12_FULL_38_13]